jgi:hypothetical protein
MQLFFNYPEHSMKRNDLITVNEAARIKGCSRQAIHAAIKSNRLEAVSKPVESVVWLVSTKSLANLVINPNMRREGRPARANGHKGGQPRKGEK